MRDAFEGVKIANMRHSMLLFQQGACSWELTVRWTDNTGVGVGQEERNAEQVTPQYGHWTTFSVPYK